MSKNIVIVYFSGYGHTQRMAEAVAQGASGTLLAVDKEGNLPEGGWETLAAADAIVFGAPTYMGSVPWQYKKFIDATSKPWYTQQWKDKIAAGFTNSASMNCCWPIGAATKSGPCLAGPRFGARRNARQ